MVRCGIPAVALVDPPTLSANANDFGWEEGFARQLEVMAKEGDLLIAISSSGESENILNAVFKHKNKLLTLSGFRPDNPLRMLGNVNLWVDSENYGVVEVAHLALLHEIVKP
jgi:D-sedoheptulose 7-phosphate isomerase